MVGHATTMRKTVLEIRDRTTNLSVFAGNYIDKTDVDADGKGTTKSFVPSAFREKLKLNHSTMVKKDSRCASVFSEIMTKMETANRDHDVWKNKMSKHAEEIGRLEIKARILILKEDFCAAILDIATCLVLVGKVKEGTPPTKNTNEDISHAAIFECLKLLPEQVWKGLPFIESIDGIEPFCKGLEATYGTTYIAMLSEKFAPTETEDNTTLAAQLDNSTIATNHPDLQLVSWVAKELLVIMPRLTTEFWEYERKIDVERKLDADLDLILTKKKIDKVNETLADAMEIDEESEAVVRSIARDEAQKVRNKTISNRKKDERKKSSGEGKAPPSQPTKSGQPGKDKSKKKKKKTSDKGRKRPTEYSSDEDSYDSRSESRGKGKRRDNSSESESSEDYHRRRLHESVLRKGAKVHWTQSTRDGRPSSNPRQPRNTNGGRGGSRSGGRGRGRGRS